MRSFLCSGIWNVNIKKTWILEVEHHDHYHKLVLKNRHELQG